MELYEKIKQAAKDARKYGDAVLVYFGKLNNIDSVYIKSFSGVLYQGNSVDWSSDEYKKILTYCQRYSGNGIKIVQE